MRNHVCSFVGFCLHAFQNVGHFTCTGSDILSFGFYWASKWWFPSLQYHFFKVLPKEAVSENLKNPNTSPRIYFVSLECLLQSYLGRYQRHGNLPPQQPACFLSGALDVGTGHFFNHFQQNRMLTTKAGLTKSLKDYSAATGVNVDSFFPRRSAAVRAGSWRKSGESWEKINMFLFFVVVLSSCFSTLILNLTLFRKCTPQCPVLYNMISTV